MRSIHKQFKDPGCNSCFTFKFSYHKEVNPKAMRVTISTSRSIELEIALTLSSFVYAEFERAEQEHKVKSYDGPNGSLFISILLHNSEFRIPKFALRISEFGIVKYI